MKTKCQQGCGVNSISHSVLVGVKIGSKAFKHNLTLPSKVDRPLFNLAVPHEPKTNCYACGA